MWKDLAMNHNAIFAIMLTAGTGASLAAAVPSNSGNPAPKSVDVRDRTTCRRFTQPGSLVANYRVCKTNREWERERENVQQLNVPASSRGAN
jgi:hypothetical protein